MEFDPYTSLSFLPKKIQNLFVAEARYLLNDLKEHVHEVTLLPAPNPKFLNHKIHAVKNANPTWYSILYHSHAHFRRNRSISALERIVNFEDKKYLHFNHKKEVFILLKKLTAKKIVLRQKTKVRLKPYVACKYGYDTIYRDFIFERLTKGYAANGCSLPPNDDIVYYFSNK